MNNHDGTFREEGLERGAALSEDGMEQAGMGLGIGDFNLDGHLDIFKTHFADDTSILYRNDGEGFFHDMTISSGLAVETRFVGWGAGMVDLDNDGLPDLFVATGNVYPEAETNIPGYRYRTPRLIYRNLDKGRFEQIIDEGGPGIAAAHASRGCAFGDYDNDGDIDILIMNMNEPPSLLRNDLAGGAHRLKVRLVGIESNRSAIGARVFCRYGERRQVQAVLSQASFYSVNDKRLHFGLGPIETADLEIRWPLGRVETLRGIPADRLVVIEEGKGIVDTKPFSKFPV
jgi:predicted nucleotidyltransferase